MHPVLEVRNLSHRFPEVTALAGISLDVAEGEIYGLVGPDGAGKTTAMRILAGVVTPTSGTVRVLGLDPGDSRSGIREHLGYMPQRYSLYGDLSVDENLRFFGDLFCLDRTVFDARVLRLLDITRLEPFRDRRADALSGGMAKKLALSTALLHEPRLLLLDEPTNGVDPGSRLELWDLLRDFSTGGMAVVVTTSYMDEAARCHRVGMVHEGAMLAEGRPDDLVAGFGDAVMRIEGIAADVLENALMTIGTGIVALTPQGTGTRAVARREAVAEIVARAGQHGGRVTPVLPTFEDMFLAMMSSGSRTSDPARDKA
jgi:ABC-2 type transport system ATP-binding protein